MLRNKGHILVVDDNRMNRLKLSRGIQQHGYTVEVADSGDQALTKLRTKQFDLIFLDIKMPDMDGYQVLTKLQNDSVLRQIPVVMVASPNEMDEVIHCLKVGAVDYLPQAFDTVMLKSHWRLIYAKSHPLFHKVIF